jgi:hypothetical protein
MTNRLLAAVAMQQAPQQTHVSGLRLEPLVARGEPAGPTRRDDARGVGVPPPARIALGYHERVLAERREVFAAERAAIRGGLEVLRAAHRPPTWLLGHRAADAIDQGTLVPRPHGPRDG